MKRTCQRLTMILIGLLLVSCTLQGNQTNLRDPHLAGMPHAQKGKALLMIALAPGQMGPAIDMLVNDTQIGTLSGSDILAVHLPPEDYMVRSSYQDCFPAEITLRQGESILILAQTTKRGLYFKPVRFSDFTENMANREIHEVSF